MIRFSCGILLLLMVAGLALPAYAPPREDKACLSYWSVGSSGCNGAKKDKEQPPQPNPSELLPQPVLEQPPQEQAEQQQASDGQPPLQERIDEFLENYDKPPEEFVAFNLEPTPENL